MNLGLLIYGSLDTISGGYLYDRRLVEYLRSQGDTVEVISLPWRNYLADLGDNLTFRLPSGLDLLIQDELNHPSLVQANRPPHPYPVVSLVHHLRCSEKHPPLLNVIYRAIEAVYLRSVDGFIYNSTTTRGVVQNLAGMHRPGIVAYPPTDRFGIGLDEDAVRIRAAGPPPLRVLFLGNLIPRKGLDLLLEALSALPLDSWTLDVVGSLRVDSGYAERVQTLVEKMGSTTAVRFHGSLSDEDLVGLFKCSHVLAVPSSYEGFGMVYLEGMAFGLPAIGTTAGAAHEIITDGVDGYLVPPGDPKPLAARLSSLTSDRDLLTKLSVNALKRYRAQPSWIETAANIRSFLHEMAGRR